MNYMMIDGTKIEISAETAHNLKKELCKPELGHGDCGPDKNGRMALRINIARPQKDGPLLLYSDGSWNYAKKNQTIRTVVGNIFDDMTEELDKFEIPVANGYGGGSVSIGNCIRIGQGNDIALIGFDFLPEFISKLQRVRNYIRNHK